MKKFIIFFIILLYFLSFNLVFAAEPNPGSGAELPNKPVELSNPLGADSNPQTLIGTIINAVLGLVGSLALAMFIYGGLAWMTAAGNQERVTKGKNILVWATIGLIVIFSAYTMVRFVFTGIGVVGENTGGTGTEAAAE